MDPNFLQIVYTRGWGDGSTGEQVKVSATNADKLSQANGAYVVSGVNSPELLSDFHKHSMCPHGFIHTLNNVIKI